MFCQFCGKEIAEGEICGCAKEREIMDSETVAEKKKGGTAAFIIAAVIALAAVVTLIVLLVVSVGGGYRKPVEKFAEAVNEGDGEILAESVCTEKMLRYFRKEKDWDYEDVCDELEDMIDDRLESWERHHGDHVQLSVEFGDEYKLDEDEIEDIEDEYRDNGYRVRIDKAYELECTVLIEGDEDGEKEEYDFIVIKVEDEGWKLYFKSVSEIL